MMMDPLSDWKIIKRLVIMVFNLGKKLISLWQIKWNITVFLPILKK